MLELSKIYKFYNPGTVNEMCLFRDFNFRVEEGEFVAIVEAMAPERPLF